MGDWYWNNRRGGGGAPVRDSVGNAVPNIKVALRGGHPNNQEGPAHGQAGGYDTHLAQESPARPRHDQSFREQPSPNVRMASLALMNGADLQERHEKRLRQQSYQQELQQQIEEKNRRKAHEKAERERLEYEDMLRYEKQLARDKAREEQEQQQQPQQQPQQSSMSRTDTFVLNSTTNSNAHNQTPDSVLRSTSVQPARTLVRASSESNIPAHRHASDNGPQHYTHAMDDVPPRAPQRERRNGRLDADMLDVVRSAAVRTSEGMVMISADLFEKLLARCEDLLASHAQLEQQCQERQHEQSRQPASRNYNVDSDNNAGARDDESVANSVTEERERLAYQKALARTRAKQETRPTRSQSQNSARPTQKTAANGNVKQASVSAPAAKRGASQPPPGRKSNAPNGRGAASANDAKTQRTGASGIRKLSSTATGTAAGASRRQVGAKEAVNERARKPGRQSSSEATKEVAVPSPRRRGDKLPNLRNPPKLQDLNDNHPSSKAPRSRVGTLGTELQADSNLLYLPADNDADYIGEDQLDVLLRNARATRHARGEIDLDYRGMS